MSDDKKIVIVNTDGYAPAVPKSESPLLANDYTLVMMVRDSIQNGHNMTRGNLAFAELVRRMAIPKPTLPLDEKPYIREDGQRSESSRGVYPELVDPADPDDPHPFAGREWVGTFQPRFGFSQDKADYNPGPSTIGWYDDPDGSGRERWWMGMVWADLYRDKPRSAR
jgi:Protein of unknown function (DUF2510).